MMTAGSPYTIEIYGSGRATATGDGLSLVPLNKTAIFNVDTQGSQGKVDVEITGMYIDQNILICFYYNMFKIISTRKTGQLYLMINGSLAEKLGSEE